MEDAAKHVIENQTKVFTSAYQQGKIRASTLFNKIHSIAKKYYKQGRISYDEYRDYLTTGAKECNGQKFTYRYDTWKR
jgi:hypothetical protein